MKHALRCHDFRSAGVEDILAAEFNFETVVYRQPKSRQPTRGCGQNRR
jgi:hypothetical protein